MSQGNIDQVDSMFCIQSFDSSTNTFGGTMAGSKSLYLGAMWVGEPLTGLDEGTLISLQSLLAGTFPAGSIMQFGLLSSPDVAADVYSYLDKKSAATNPLLIDLVKRQSKTIANGTDSPVVRASGVLLSKKRLIITLKCAYEKPATTNLIDFEEQSSKFESSLRANSLQISRATPPEYLATCRLLTHIYDEPDSRYDSEMSLSEQVFYNGDEVIINKESLEFNTGSKDSRNFVMGALSPKFLPKDFNLALMNYVIGDPKGMSNQLKNPYYMVLTMYYPDQMDKKASVDKKASWINHQLFGGSASKFLPKLVLKKEGFDTLQTEIETNSAVLVEASFTLWIYSKKKQELKSMQEDIRTYWASLGFNMRADKIILDVLLGESLPMNGSSESAKGLFRTHTLTSSQAAQFMPLLGEWRGSPNPTVLLTTRRGEVAGFDLYNSSSNYNAVLVAQSGSGKSFWTQRLITDYLAEGAKVWVIDSGRSYQKLAASVGGTFMEFSPESNICLNPFTSFLDERGGSHKKIEDNIDIISSLIERMAAQRDPLGDLDMETIRKAIRQTFIENQGHSTIQDISNWLTAQTEDIRAKELALRLDSFAYGQYAKFFNGHGNVNMSNDFVVLELSDLKNQRQLQQVVLLQLVAQITNEMYLTRGRKKILIIDEAWDLLNDPVMARAMEAANRQARKEDGAVVTVTQGISDLYNSPSGKAMIDNAAWQLILAQKAEAIDDVYDSGQLTIDAYNYHMLKTVRTVPGSHSEIMILGNGGCGIFRLTVDKFTQALYSTSGKERTQVLEDIENGVDVTESIQRLIVGDESYERVERLRQQIEETMRSGISQAEILHMIKTSVANIDEMIERESR
jgi:conjugal transfer ATP-binding protein TraC